MLTMKQLIDKARKYKNICLAGHVNPDGDCIGATLALKKIFKNAGIESSIYLTSKPKMYDFLDGFDDIMTKAPEKVDLLIILDVSTFDRIGEVAKKADDAYKIIIDHHIAEEFLGDINYIDSSFGSTCELLYSMLENHELLDKEIASALYSGIIYDTGGFKHTNVRPSTFAACSKLLEYGIDSNMIMDKIMYEKSFSSFKAEGLAFSRLYLTLDDRLAITYLTYEDFKKLKIGKNDTEKIVSYINDVIGIKCAVFLYPSDAKSYKVSFRSRGNVDVSKVASFFGGGGHKNASGATVTGNIDECINKITKQIIIEMDDERNN